MSRHQTMLLVLFMACSVQAQTPDAAIIRGQVVDQSRAGISGVAVSVKNLQTGLERTTETDGSGNFSLAGLPVAGTYDVTAVKSGFADAHLNGVALAGGTTADLNLQLQVAGRGGET